MRLTRPQLTAQQRLTSLRGSALGAEEMAFEVALALEAAIGWNGYRLFSLSADGLGYERLLAASADDGLARLIFLRDTYGVDDPGVLAPLGLARPFAQLPRAAAVNPRLIDCHGIDPAIRRSSDTRAYEEANRYSLSLHDHIFQGHGMMLGTFSGRAGPVALMHAYRLAPGPDFPASAVAFLSLVAPVVGELLEGAIQRDRHAASLAPDVSGILIVDQAGTVSYASPAAETWVRALGQGHGDLETGLPASVWMALTRLRTRPAGTHLRVGMRGGRARIEVAPGGAEGLAALVIAPERTPDDGWRPLLAIAGLTAAEERVARLVARGLSNREVAADLSISANTVEWHLRRVYDKLGVRSRGHLVSQLAGDAAADPFTVEPLSPTVVPAGGLTSGGATGAGVTASGAPNGVVIAPGWGAARGRTAAG